MEVGSRDKRKNGKSYRTLVLVMAFILMLLTASCTAQETSGSISTSASGGDSASAANPPPDGGYPDIQVRSPVTLSNNPCTLNGQPAYMRVKMVSGTYSEDWNPGAYEGTLWQGSFEIELADEYGKTIAKTDISKVFLEPPIFKSTFDIEFGDYNGDGDPDFTIGQYTSSNGREYWIFTLRKDGKVEELPVKDHAGLFISDSTGYYSTKLNKINETSFEIEYYSNAYGSAEGGGTFHDFYEWDGKQFVLSESQKMTQAEAAAGSIEDENTQYAYVSCDQQEIGFMQFTRTGTQIEGDVEIAAINKNGQVERKKYPFKGTLVNNYISITFPGAAWMNSEKGITWIGTFDYQSIMASVPVDTSTDPGGFVTMTYNRGTADDFEAEVSSLESKAKG